MTKAEKAVAIAKDVLKQIDNYKEVRRGIYLKGTLPLSFINLNDSVQPYIDKVQKECEVCALGACFLSYIRIHNKVNFNDLLYANMPNEMNVEFDYMMKKLNLIFSDNQLDEIEAAFELWPHENEKLVENCDAKSFGERYKSPKECLIAIMKNIVKNKGKFIPVTKKGN